VGEALPPHVDRLELFLPLMREGTSPPLHVAVELGPPPPPPPPLYLPGSRDPPPGRLVKRAAPPASPAVGVSARAGMSPAETPTIFLLLLVPCTFPRVFPSPPLVHAAVHESPCGRPTRVGRRPFFSQQHQFRGACPLVTCGTVFPPPFRDRRLDPYQSGC